MKRKYGAGKIAIFICCVVIPAVAVGISNWEVFRESFWIATLLLAITVGVGAVVAWYSGDATPKVRRYCIGFHFVLGVVLCVNFASHFVVSREVSAAREYIERKRVEEDRQEKFRQSEAQRQERLMAEEQALEAARAKNNQAEANRLYQLRKMGYQGAPPFRSVPTPTATAAPMPIADTSIEKPKSGKTPEEVLESWQRWLTVWAFVDVFVAIIGGLILYAVWEWDMDGDGVADHLQWQEVAPRCQQPVGFRAAEARGEASNDPNAPRR